jgi:hypothetical protein
MQILIALSTKNAPPCSHASNELVVDTNVFVRCRVIRAGTSAGHIRGTASDGRCTLWRVRRRLSGTRLVQRSPFSVRAEPSD